VTSACAKRVAQRHVGLGNLYWCTGPHDQTREHLTSAMTMYREMGMRFRLEQAEAGRDT